jgi:hypothetical protein
MDTPLKTITVTKKIRNKGIGSGRHDPNKQPIDETTESFRNFIRRFRNSSHTKKAYTTL